MNQIGDEKTGGERNHDATDALDEHAIMPGSQRFVGRDNTLNVDHEIFGLGGDQRRGGRLQPIGSDHVSRDCAWGNRYEPV